jgi:hypothetical protein
MRGEQLEVSVTFDERRGYVASAPELRQPVTALSLGGLRKRIEALICRTMLPCGSCSTAPRGRSATDAGGTPQAASGYRCGNPFSLDKLSRRCPLAAVRPPPAISHKPAPGPK